MLYAVPSSPGPPTLGLSNWYLAILMPEMLNPCMTVKIPSDSDDVAITLDITLLRIDLVVELIVDREGLRPLGMGESPRGR